MKERKKERREYSNARAITLIALIITIIIMLILISTTIYMVIQSDLIGATEQATEEMDIAQEKEQIQEVLEAWIIQNYTTKIDLVEYFSAKDMFEKVAYYDETELEIICRMSESKRSYLVNIENGEIKYYDGNVIQLDNDVIVVGIDEVTEIKAKYDHEVGTIEWLNSNEDVVEITTEKNIVKFEVLGSGNAVITAKVGEYTAECEILVPEINSAGKVTSISTSTKSGLLKINELNEEGFQEGTIDINDDIDMENVEWRPLRAIGLKINGNGNKISNLNCIQETDYGRSGFFGYAGGSTVYNLTLENVTATGTQAGAFFGLANDGATIVNCKLMGDNVISWRQNPGDYKEDYSGIAALIGIPYASSSKSSSATIEGNVIIRYNDMTSYFVDIDETGALGFVDSSVTSLAHNSIDTTNATITKEGTWTKK